jgi:nitric oxide dioxygenase
MTLTASQIEMVRDSFKKLDPTPEVSESFYNRLFERAPELRELFRSDMTGQGMRFMTTLGVILDHIDDPKALQPYLERLAEGHAAYGVQPQHFKPMGEALIATMRDALGDDFPEAAASAWEEAYAHIAREMIAAAG